MPKSPKAAAPAPSSRDPEGFNAWDPLVLNKIDELIALAKPPATVEDNRDLIQQIIVTALKAEYAQLDRGDIKILSRAMRELRYGFRIFKHYRNRRKVTMFGSARTSKGDPDYKQALQFAREIAKHDFMLITGAGPGIMEAGNEGAGKGNSFGINIRLPYEQEANVFISKDPLFIDCRFFFTRKLMFVKETSAVVFFPGGFGTHDEAMEVLTLVQTGKSDPMPIVFIDSPGGDYWKDWQRYVERQLVKKKKISPEDVSLYKITDNNATAVKEIIHFYSNYHSMRYVKNQLVLRMKKAPSPQALQMISADFKDICEKGTFTVIQPYPEEDDHLDLARVSFIFNRIHFGRLRQLIDRINSL